MCYTASGATPDGVGVVYPAGKVAVVLAQPVDEEGAETEGDRAYWRVYIYYCTSTAVVGEVFYFHFN